MANKQLIDEIGALDKRATKRKIALRKATQELDGDRKDIMTFMEKNNETRRQRELEEK